MTILKNPELIHPLIFKQIPSANDNLKSYMDSIARGVSSKDWLENFFRQGDLILLLYPDNAASGGLGCLVAKGRPHLEQAVAEQRDLLAKVGSFIVGNKAEALVAGITYGDVPRPAWLGDAPIKRRKRKQG